MPILACSCGVHCRYQKLPQLIDYFRERGHIAKLHSPNESCPLRLFLRVAGKLRVNATGSPFGRSGTSSLESLLDRFAQSRTVEIE